MRWNHRPGGPGDEGGFLHDQPSCKGSVRSCSLGKLVWALAPLCKNNDVAECRVVRSGETFAGRQGFTYFAGISAETVGSKAVCMHMLRIPPGGRANVHLHEN